EEESESPQGFLAALLEAQVIDAVEDPAEQEEQRRQDERDQDRVEAVPAVDDIGDVGAENDEARMGDVHHVEHAERDRDAHAHCRVEPAEEQPGDDGVQQQRRRDIHGDKGKPPAVAAGLVGGTRSYFVFWWYGAFRSPLRNSFGYSTVTLPGYLNWSTSFPAMLWYCVMMTRDWAHSPFCAKRTFPTKVSNSFLCMYSASFP